MRLSQKIIILKDMIVLLLMLGLFASITCYKVGKVNGYQKAYIEIID